jgi:general secretion pathway protein G
MNRRKKSLGFTLIEMLVVVAIIGILAGIIVVKIANKPDEARVVRAKQDIASLQTALDLYKLDNGTYPTTEQGLDALVTQPSDPPMPPNWHAYLSKIPTDPWNRPYLYQNPGEHGDIDIYTYGPTGQAGGKGTNATIGNWSTN